MYISLAASVWSHLWSTLGKMLVSSRGSAPIVAVLLLSLTATNLRATTQQAQQTCFEPVQTTREQPAVKTQTIETTAKQSAPPQANEPPQTAGTEKPAAAAEKSAAETQTTDVTDKQPVPPQAKEQPQTAETEKPAAGPDSGDKALGEGPDELAKKFAELLSKGLADVARNKPSQEAPQQAAQEQTLSEAKPEPAPAAAEAVEEPPTITVLILRNPDDLATVPRTERIGRLILSGDDISNRSLRGLAGLSVSELSIEAMRVSNVGLQYVKSAKGIRRLRLWSPAFDDEALKYVAELPDLQILDVEGTAMEGAGLEELKGLLKLNTLVLGPRTSDSQLGSLKHLGALQQLDLRACPRLTLACLEHLAQLADLKIVWLPGHIRTQGKRMLRESLPECEVRS